MFIEGRSMVTQLLKIMDKWPDHLERRPNWCYIEKAIDKVPHKILIQKFKGFNINNIVISWITLISCKQKAKS